MIQAFLNPICSNAEENISYAENFDLVTNTDALDDTWRDSWYIGGTRPEIQGEGENKYLAIAKDNGIEWCPFSEGFNSGKVSVKMSVKAMDGSAGLVEMLSGEDSVYFRKGLYASQITGRSFGILKSWDSPKIATGVSGEWYDLIYTLDFDNGTYGIQIIKDDKVFTQKRDIPMTMEDYNETLPDLYALRFRNWGEGMFYVDNLSVSRVTHVTDRDDVIFEQDFEDVTVGDINKYGFSTNDAFASVEQLDEEHKNSFKITTNSGELKKDFPEITTGKFRFSYSLHTEGDWAIAEAISSTDSYQFLGLALFSGGGKFYCSEIGESQEGYLCTTAASTDWVRVENIVDMDEKTVTYRVLDNTGKVCEKKIEKIVNAIDKTTEITGLNAFRVRNWRESGEIYIDDVELSFYNPAPKITTADIEIKDSFGNDISDITNNVNPAIGEISLDFGCGVLEDSAKEAITLTDDKNESANFEIKIQGEKVVLVLSSALKQNTSYTLSVSDSLLGKNGKLIKESFSFTFRTGAGTLMSRIWKIRVNGNEEITINDFAAGANVSVSPEFINTTTDSADLSVIISYFKGTVCVKSESRGLYDLPGGTVGVEPQSFTVPEISGLTLVKIMLWNGVKNMVPYCSVVTIK